MNPLQTLLVVLLSLCVYECLIEEVHISCVLLKSIEKCLKICLKVYGDGFGWAPLLKSWGSAYDRGFLIVNDCPKIGL